MKHIDSLQLLTLFLLTCSSHVLAQCGDADPTRESAQGFVFLDQNRNGLRESNEPGIGAVSVSNGCDVTLTDASGHYQISLAATEILFISQPSGYAVTVDANQLPQFFYRHYPDGTPAIIAGTSVEWLWPVTAATGPLPASIDFPLQRQQNPSPAFSAYGFADPQARYEVGQDMVREDLVNTLIGNPYQAQFGLTVGDIVFDTLSLYDRHKQMMALMDIPQWNLPGNHDINYESPNALFANETYKQHFGPTYYSFNHGNVHLVSLNNVEYAGAGKRIDNDRYRGYISGRQLTWLRHDLEHVAKDKLIVIATHIPLIAEAVDASGAAPATGPGTENFAELLKILEPFDSIYAVAGHDTSNSWKVEINHSHGWQGRPWIAHTLAEVRGNGWTTGPADYRGVRDAMMQDGNPNGFYLLKFDDVSVVPEFIPFPYGQDASARLRIVLDPPLVETAEGSVNRGALQPGTRVVVNLFDGGIRDSVWLSVNKSEPVAMTYTVRTDPFVVGIYRQLEETDDAIGNPTRSAHIWELELPAGLEPGIQRLEVFSEDEFGQTQSAALSFEITER